MTVTGASAAMAAAAATRTTTAERPQSLPNTACQRAVTAAMCASTSSRAIGALGVADNQVLDDEFDVDDAARIMLEGKVSIAIQGVCVVHLAAHGDDVFLQLGQVARQAQDFRTDILETPADRRVAGAEAGPGQGLVFPCPGVFQLVVAEGLDRHGEQPGVAVRAQAQVGFEQDAGRCLVRYPTVQAL